MAAVPAVIGGVVAPVPTPFAADGSPDLEALARHLGWLEAEGADGALVLGTTGEFASLTLEERLRVAEAAAAARGRLRLLLGVGSCALPEVRTMLAAALRLGYDAALLPPPFYLPAGQEGIAGFLRAALDAAELPVLLYHIPRLTGVPLGEDLLDRLRGHPHLAGIKDSSDDAAEMARLAPRFARLAYMVGSDRLVAACRTAGGAGAITVVADVAPGAVRAAWEDPGRQAELARLRAHLDRHGAIASVKAVLAARGLMRPDVRPPLETLPGTLRDALLEAVGG